MTATLSRTDTAKFAAGKRAAGFVESGMKVGLGTGSTAAWMVRALGERMRDEGLKFTGVATSSATEKLAKDLGIPTIPLNEARWLDLTIDGADEVDRDFNLIKGGGAALLQEKIVATASDRMIVITDATKRVEALGAFPLPVEVLGFGLSTTQMLVEEMLESMDVMATKTTLRKKDGKPIVTDEGNHILDLHLGRIGNPRLLSLVLNQIPGVVENGLFVDICDVLVTGFGDGRVEVHDINAGEDNIETLAPAPSENVFSDMTD